MHLRSVALAAAMALATNAFLVIPHGLSAEGFSQNTAAVGATAQRVKLPCHGCPLSPQSQKPWRASFARNSLELDLKIKHESVDSLVVNDVPIFPRRFGQPLPSFMATQVAEKDNQRARVEVTSYMIAVSPAVTIDEDGLELMPITFKIFALGGQKISLAEVTVMLLKDTKGSLYIGSVSNSKGGSGRVMDASTCRKWPSVCKIKNMSMHKFDQLKAAFGCHGSQPRPQHGRIYSHTSYIGDGRPQQGRPHHHHRPQHHSQSHSFFHGFISIIVLPILLGMAAGALTYALVMFFALLSSHIVAAIRGTPREGYVVLVEDEEQPVSDKEIGAHVDAELPADAPPSYQDMPEKQ